jgi:CheY-like chemotaxis protein/two-component sensor histidine kinase
VEDLLDTARVTQGKIEPKWEIVDLVALLARAVDGARRSLTEARDQQLRLSVPDEPVLVRGDSLRLEQVFSNLLDNASKYTEGGGQIDVRLQIAAGNARRARVTVTDTGIGIPPDALGTIFNLFSQAEVPLSRSRGGLGIGLTLVRSLVELHGGTVSARSEGIGRGCEMEVSLPITDAQPVALPQAGQPDVRSKGRLRILVVEDNIDAQSMLRLLLEMWGHEVSVASDGEAGIAAIQTHQPDIALVDIGLPVADGYELAQRVTTETNGKKPLLIALTGYGAPEQRTRALESGFDLHLVKPVEPEQLARLIGQERE